LDGKTALIIAKQQDDFVANSDAIDFGRRGRSSRWRRIALQNARIVIRRCASYDAMFGKARRGTHVLGILHWFNA
jgi:hypothetical protein